MCASVSSFLAAHRQPVVVGTETLTSSGTALQSPANPGSQATHAPPVTSLPSGHVGARVVVPPGGMDASREAVAHVKPSMHSNAAPFQRSDVPEGQTGGGSPVGVHVKEVPSHPSPSPAWHVGGGGSPAASHVGGFGNVVIGVMAGMAEAARATGLSLFLRCVDTERDLILLLADDDGAPSHRRREGRWDPHKGYPSDLLLIASTTPPVAP